MEENFQSSKAFVANSHCLNADYRINKLVDFVINLATNESAITDFKFITNDVILGVNIIIFDNNYYFFSIYSLIANILFVIDSISFQHYLEFTHLK